MPDTELDKIASSDGIMEMLSGVRENVAPDYDPPVDDEWSTTPTDVEDSGVGDAPTPESGVGTQDAGAANAPEAAAETKPEEVGEAEAGRDETPPDTENEAGPEAATDDAAPDAEPEPEPEPEPVVVDYAKLDSEYQQAVTAIPETVERKYFDVSQKIHADQQREESSFNAFVATLREQANAIYDAAVEVDPITGSKAERGLVPSEHRRLEEIREKLAEAGKIHSSRMGEIASRAREVNAAYDRDVAVAKVDAWTNYMVTADPRLEPYKATVRDMAARGEIHASADGRIDGEELLMRAQYRAKLTGQVATTKSGRVVSQSDIQKAQQIQAEKRQQAAVKERGLGTIAAGKGGGAAAKPGGAKGEPDYMKGASPEAIAGLKTLDAYLKGEY